MQQQEVESKPVYESREAQLVGEFSNFLFPKHIQDMLKGGYNPIGSPKLIKSFFYAAQVQLENDDYDTLMAVKPQRREGENNEYYKQRTKLQKFLGDMKPYFYDYSVYDLGAKKRKIAARRAKRAILSLN